ncbi:acyltransferase family protein [Rhodoferax ferrireducens]|uniref:acyltransferase family protein n=1 Tax=Rhodoferax ferrireducens TaxID=192843 RepID=UPI00298D746F|nr:acyltransferase family protein [Rhodoferax ferrireducens]WPC67458.1 acyltransferase family protein [Rhodoferax ferrireducens]
MNSARPGRQTHVDALKLLASQLIVLHHFATYGPLADALSKVAPALTNWFYDYARMAVQVFLVLGGYLAVRSLAPAGQLRAGAPWRAILQRYQRLILPFLAALVLAVASAALARQWLSDDFIPGAPTWAQALAHAALLHGVLGHDSLSAGVWYVAIDFQLFALMTLLLWLGRRPRWPQALLLGLMLASLFFFNRDEDWDNWALYFFGAYGMGAAAFWAGNARRPGWLLGLLAGVGLLALVLDFRERITLALAVALLLGLLQWRHHTAAPPLRLPASLSHAVALLGKTSYALFLVHFSVLMIGNALFAQLGLGASWLTWLFLLGCWASCLGLAVLFERWVEAPLSRLGYRRNKGLSSASPHRAIL